MTRSDVTTRMWAYLDGELDAGSRAEFEALLAKSPDLAEQLDRLRMLRAAVVRTAVIPTPPGLEGRIRSAISRRPRLRRSALLGALALAACLGLFYFLGRWQAREEIPLVPAAQFVAWHDSFTAGAGHTEIEVDAHCCAACAEFALKPRYDHPVLVPDFAPAGLNLESVCTCLKLPGGVGAVHSYYRAAHDHPGGAETVSFFSLTGRILLGDTSEERPGVARQYQLARCAGATVLKWDEGDLSFAIVGASGADRLKLLADEVRIARATAALSLHAFAMLP